MEIEKEEPQIENENDKKEINTGTEPILSESVDGTENGTFDS